GIVELSNSNDANTSDIEAIDADLTDVTDTVDGHTTTIADHESRLPTAESTLATRAADNAVVKLTGNQTISGTKTFNSAPIVPDNAFAISKVNGLQTALNAKAPLA